MKTKMNYKKILWLFLLFHNHFHVIKSQHLVNTLCPSNCIWKLFLSYLFENDNLPFEIDDNETQIILQFYKYSYWWYLRSYALVEVRKFLIEPSSLGSASLFPDTPSKHTHWTHGMTSHDVWLCSSSRSGLKNHRYRVI